MHYYVAAHTGSHITQALLSDGAGHIISFIQYIHARQHTKLASYGLLSKVEPCGMYTCYDRILLIPQ